MSSDPLARWSRMLQGAALVVIARAPDVDVDAAAALKALLGRFGGKGGGKTAKAIDEGARLIAHLQDQARAVQELTAVERLESEIADGKYKKLSD